MPRSSSTVRSYTPSTPGVIGELGIAWSSSGGHTHDGIESTLINGESYSVFDFRPVNRGTTNERSLIQDRNREALKAFIVETIKTDYIEFNNILIGPDVIGAQNIIAGSISSELIAANTIVANNIAANTITTELLATDAITSLNFDWNGSSTFSNSGTRLSLTDGQIIGKNIRVDASGNLSVSGSGTFTGTINASGGTFTGKMTAGLTEIGNNIRGASNYAGLALRNDSWENAWVKRSDNSVYFRAGSSTKYIQVDTTGTTTIQFPNFSVDNNGNISATNATVSGTINASSGTFSGTITASGTISGGTISGATITGSTFTTTGSSYVSISGSSMQLINMNSVGYDAEIYLAGQLGYGGRIRSNNVIEIRGQYSTDSWIRVGDASGRISIGTGSSDTRLTISTTAVTANNDLNAGGSAQIDGSITSGTNIRSNGVYYGSGVNSAAKIYHRNGGFITFSIEGSRVFFVKDDSTVIATLEGAKTFVINHPVDQSKYLVHAAAEGPTADVFYRGEGRIENGKCVIALPDYFEALTLIEGRTVHITPIYNGRSTSTLRPSRIKNGKFTVYSQDQIESGEEFYWRVDAVRENTNFDIEPDKSSKKLMGDGPYTYLV